MTKVIYSANDSGLSCLVDDEDYDLNVHRWHICPGRYAHCWATMKALHKLIAERMGLVGRIDHRNRNKLDNRRENLRLATASQNLANVGLSKRNKTGYRGVKEENGRWTVTASIDREPVHLGVFDTPEEAAIAYDLKTQEAYGEFARPNIVNPDPKLVERVRTQLGRAKQHRGTSRYHGVTYANRPYLKRQWMAWGYWPDGRTRNMGYFATEEEAARAVDAELDRTGSTRTRNFPNLPPL